MLEFLCRKVSVRLVYHLCILRDAIIAVTVTVVSLIRIVREGNDADLFIGKRYIQLVTFITELLLLNSCYSSCSEFNWDCSGR